MGLDNAERQARWRAKQNAEIERLRKATAEQAEQLAEARREIEIAVLERENATLKMALAHERKQHAEAKTRAAKPRSTTDRAWWPGPAHCSVGCASRDAQSPGGLRLVHG